MICETDSHVSWTSGGYAAHVLRAVWIAAVVAVLCLALFLSVGRTKLSQVGAELVVTFIYSTLIGLPSMLLLLQVSRRYSEKYPRGVIVLQALALVITCTAGVLVGGLLLQLIRIVPRREYWYEFRAAFPFSIVITLAVGLSIATFETLRHKYQTAQLELRTRQMEQERAYKLLAEAQLSSLESRIRPHFLFNTLNSIAALIPSDPVRAEDTVGKLASLLRFSLSANHSSLVPLSQELKIVRDYLEIEKTRFGQRLRYEIAVPDALADVKTPPLALQSLVENVVKHVVSERTEGATIQIEGSLMGPNGDHRIQLQVCDDGPGFSLDAITPEHGLGNLAARLELLFGSAGKLDVTHENGKTVVRLSFPASS